MAVASEVTQRGQEASVAGVLERSGVPASAFARRYATLEDCALEVYERFIAAYERRISLAFNAYSDWRSALRAAAYETADWIEEYPDVTSFGATGVLGLRDELARVRREEVFLFGAALIDLGREDPDSQIDDDDTSAAMFAIGSIIQSLTHRLQTKGPLNRREHRCRRIVVVDLGMGILAAQIDQRGAEEKDFFPTNASQLIPQPQDSRGPKAGDVRVFIQSSPPSRRPQHEEHFANPMALNADDAPLVGSYEAFVDLESTVLRALRINKRKRTPGLPRRSAGHTAPAPVAGPRRPRPSRGGPGGGPGPGRPGRLNRPTAGSNLVGARSSLLRKRRVRTS